MPRSSNLETCFVKKDPYSGPLLQASAHTHRVSVALMLLYRNCRASAQPPTTCCATCCVPQDGAASPEEDDGNGAADHAAEAGPIVGLWEMDGVPAPQFVALMVKSGFLSLSKHTRNIFLYFR